MILLFALLISVLPPATLAGQDEGPPGNKQPMEGLWPTRRMTESMVKRWALEAADDYDLSEVQYAQVEQEMLERWPAFLESNRTDLQPLLNEYLETQMGFEPPDPSQVQDWAKRALPMVDKCKAQLADGQSSIRKLLTPAQRIKFKVKSLAVNAGLQVFRQQIEGWSQGKNLEGAIWDPPRRREPQSPEKSDQASGKKAAQAGAPSVDKTDEVELELHAWDQFVAKFIEGHRLTNAQRATAMSVLNELKARARSHRDANREAIVKLEKLIAAGAEDDGQKVQDELVRLYGPIDAMFGELEERIMRIPTAAQSKAASQPAEAPATQGS